MKELDRLLAAVQAGTGIREPGRALAWLQALTGVLADAGGPEARRCLEDVLPAGSLSSEGAPASPELVTALGGAHPAHALDVITSETKRRTSSRSRGAARERVEALLALIKEELSAEQLDEVAATLPRPVALKLREATLDTTRRARAQSQRRTRPLDERVAKLRPREQPHLTCSVGEHQGRLFSLAGVESLTVGAGDDCDLSIVHDDSVSWCHAELKREPGAEGLLIRDLDSRNGTFVNGRKVGTVPLVRGDRIQVGEKNRFKFDLLSEEESAHWQAGLVDELTGCWNKRHLNRELPTWFAHAIERSEDLSLLLMDVDFFREINNEHSYESGDDVLRQLAGRTRARLESAASDAPLFRYGGEEFVALLPGVGGNECAAIAESLRAGLEEHPLDCSGQPLRVTASIGWVTLGKGGFAGSRSMFRAADRNVKQAKREGRNRVFPPPA